MKAQAQKLLRYHHWASTVLMQVVSQVTDENYFKDVGLFFKSIHGTINHLLLADRVWMGRLIARPYAITGLDQELVADRLPLSEAYVSQAELWITWLDRLETSTLDQKVKYQNSKGMTFENELFDVLTHVINHGSHHRGQISTALTSMGYQAPVMDYIYFRRIR